MSMNWFKDYEGKKVHGWTYGHKQYRKPPFLTK